MVRLWMPAVVLLLLIGCEKDTAAKSPHVRDGPVGQVDGGEGGARREEPQTGPTFDPEMKNGLVKEVLSGRAFTVRDFGSPPDGNAEDVIRGLEEEARGGSGAASYAIHLKLWQCANVLKPGRERASVDARRWKECKDLTPGRLEESIDWLRLASRQGHLGAQIQFSSDADAVVGGMQGVFRNPDSIDEFKQAAVGFMGAAAKRGSVDALMWLGDTYRYGVIAEQDPARSHAYYLAINRAAPDLVSQRLLQTIGKDLTPRELERSQLMSKEIYDECCK